MTKERISLRLQPSTDETLDCLVCRRKSVDAEIVYGITGGRAATGVHMRCVGRAESVPYSGRPIRRERRESR